VNRIPLSGVILGQENTVAGFQVLDSEPRARFAPLLARWEDRVVFAFPLLTVLQRLELTPDKVEIRLGEYLKLGPNGPTVPLDRFGRLAVPLRSVSPFAEIPAELLIDGGDEIFPKQAPEPVILRDDRSGAEPATRSFSKNLPAMVAAIASDTGLAPAHDYRRLQAKWELLALLFVALGLAAVCGLPAFARNIGFLTITTVCLAAQSIAAASAMLWLPGIPALAAVCCGLVVSMIIAVPPPSVKTLTEPEPEPELKPKAKPRTKVIPEPEIAPPAKKISKPKPRAKPKPAPKPGTPAKPKPAPSEDPPKPVKRAARKTPAKKAAKKTNSRAPQTQGAADSDPPKHVNGQ
jgi:hypothetical protein